MNAGAHRVERQRGASLRAKFLSILSSCGAGLRAEGLASPRANLCERPRLATAELIFLRAPRGGGLFEPAEPGARKIFARDVSHGHSSPNE